MGGPNERMTIKVRGRVQGVFFRANTAEKARALRLTGWVRNAEDGGVEIVAEGRPEDLEVLAAWCQHGPPAAQVTSRELVRGAATGEYTDFRIVF